MVDLPYLMKLTSQLKVYQSNEYSDQQGKAVQQRYNDTELPLTYWGDRLRFMLESPAFENTGISNFYWTSSTDYTVGGNLFSIEI